ncbi:hypothetical protein [Clostridium sp.]|uniref:alginate O-acetyltransferase AlgX-related protein n=1 Tax=Clostridium sp. TaxID=1506 RepID=UPI003463C630
MINSTYKKIVILIFMLIIITPLTLTLINPKEINLSNEDIIKKPSLFENNKINKNYTKDFENFISTNFTSRDKFIEANSLLRYKLFDLGASDKVIIGENQWMYLSDTLEQYSGTKTYNEDTLKKFKINLEEKNKFLNKNGIEMLVVIAPNKNSIYPQYMPLNKPKIRNRNSTDEFFTYMKNNSDVNILDLRKDLIDSKSKEELYHRTDSHWNHIGASLAYKRIIEESSKLLPEYNLKPYNIEIDYNQNDSKLKGDLSSMLLLDKHISDNSTSIKNKVNYEYKAYHDHDKEIRTASYDKTLPKAVIFRDSFSIYLQPLLSQNFSEALYIWGTRYGDLEDDYFNKDIILNNKPDIVIIEIAERLMDGLTMDFHQ